MSARINVFLCKSLPKLTTSMISEGISSADWLTLGEAIDLDDPEVEAFMKGLTWIDEPLGFDLGRDLPAGIDIHRDADDVKFLVEELDEFTSLVIPTQVRGHLANVQTIVCITMTTTLLRTMYEVVAFEIAYWLCEEFDGVILSDDHQWYDHDAHRWKPIQ